MSNVLPIGYVPLLQAAERRAALDLWPRAPQHSRVWALDPGGARTPAFTSMMPRSENPVSCLYTTRSRRDEARRPLFGGSIPHRHDANVSSKTLACFRSSVSKPSVNQP